MASTQQYPFEVILKRLKLGAKVHRKAWEFDNKVPRYLEFANDSIVEVIVKGSYCRYWHPTQEDILAEDWVNPAE